MSGEHFKGNTAATQGLTVDTPTSTEFMSIQAHAPSTRRCRYARRSANCLRYLGTHRSIEQLRHNKAKHATNQSHTGASAAILALLRQRTQPHPTAGGTYHCLKFRQRLRRSRALSENPSSDDTSVELHEQSDKRLHTVRQ